MALAVHRLPAPGWLGWCMHRCTSLPSMQHAWLDSRQSDCSDRSCADDAGQWVPREVATNIQNGLRAPDPRCSKNSAVCHPSALMHHQRACKAFASCEMLYHRACGCSAAACRRLGLAPTVVACAGIARLVYAPMYLLAEPAARMAGQQAICLL